MKKYRFTTSLSKDKIRKRIRIHAIPYCFSNTFRSNTLLYLERGDELKLVKTGALGVGRGAPFLFVQIKDGEIRGKWVMSKVYQIVAAIFVAFAWVKSIILPAFLYGLSVNIVVSSLVVIICMLLIYKFLPLIVSNIFFKKQMLNVLSFIESRLLK